MTRERIRPSDAAVALWPGVLLVAVGVAGFIRLLDWVREGEDLSRFDQPLLEWFATHRTPGVTTVLTVVTEVFGPVILPVIIACVALVWWKVTGSAWHPALLVGAMIGSTAMSMLLKWVVERDRPIAELMSIPGHEDSYSFPSGHTIGASTLVMVVGYLLWHEGDESGRRMAAWAVLSVAVIGTVALSRLYLGYHFLTDVLAGVCVALGVLGVVVGIERWRDLALERVDPPPPPHALRHHDDREADGGERPAE